MSTTEHQPASQALSFFGEFRQKLDGLTAEAWTQYGSQMQCKKGCSMCCRGDFHISLVEAHQLRQSLLQLPAATKEILLQNLSNFTPERCPLLDDKGACQAYEDRPLLCRVFGYPIRIPASGKQNEHIATCELNFQDQQNTEFQAQCFDKATIQDVLNQISELFLNETHGENRSKELPIFTVAEVLQATLAPTIA